MGHRNDKAVFFSIYGALSHFQASPSDIDVAHLSLTNPSPDKVHGSFKQLLRTNNNAKVVLQTSNYETKKGLLVYSNVNHSMQFLGVPVDDWLRSQLNEIETFVVSNVKIPENIAKSPNGQYYYKPLKRTNLLYINISKWCRYFELSYGDGGYIPVNNLGKFTEGSYNMNIEVSHVYVGPHKNGEHYSLSLRIVQIVYKQENEIDLSLESALLDSALETASDKKRKRTTKKAKGETEKKGVKSPIPS